jgi:hypothetical protein
MSLTRENTCAPGGIRTPNLLIRRSRSGVRRGPPVPTVRSEFGARARVSPLPCWAGRAVWLPKWLPNSAAFQVREGVSVGVRTKAGHLARSGHERPRTESERRQLRSELRPGMPPCLSLIYARLAGRPMHVCGSVAPTVSLNTLREGCSSTCVLGSGVQGRCGRRRAPSER